MGCMELRSSLGGAFYPFYFICLSRSSAFLQSQRQQPILPRWWLDSQLLSAFRSGSWDWEFGTLRNMDRHHLVTWLVML